MMKLNGLGLVLGSLIIVLACKPKKGPDRAMNASSGITGNATAFHTVGEGFDRFTGESRGNCFDLAQRDFDVERLNQTESHIEIVDTKTDLMRRTARSRSLGVEISYTAFAVGATRSTATIDQIDVSDRDFIVVSEIVYKDRSVRVASEQPPLRNDISEIIDKKADVFEFRDECGDMYVKEAILGSRLLLLIKATTSLENTYSREEITTALTVGISNMVSLGAKVGVEIGEAEETRDILTEMDFEVHCVTEGAAPTSICGEYQIDFGNPELLSQVGAGFQKAKQDFIASVEAEDAGAKHVRLSTDFDGYSDAQKLIDEAGEELDKRLERVNEIYEIKEKMKSQCANGAADRNSCNQTLGDLDAILFECTNQTEWDAKCPAPPTEESLNSLLGPLLDAAQGFSNAGFIRFFADRDQRGTTVQVDFTNMLAPGARYVPETPYFLGDGNNELEGQRLNDEVRSIQVQLQPGWEIVLYENSGRGGRSIIVKDTMQVNIRDLDANLERELTEFELRRTQTP